MDTLKTCLYEHLYKYDVIACFLGATSSDQPNLWLQQVGPLFLPEWPGNPSCAEHWHAATLARAMWTAGCRPVMGCLVLTPPGIQQTPCSKHSPPRAFIAFWEVGQCLPWRGLAFT